MAHEPHRLVLLYPYPDTVHGSPLHKTLLSTSLALRSLPRHRPWGTFSLAEANCKYRASLTPRLAQLLYHTLKNKILQVIFGNCRKKLFFTLQKCENRVKYPCKCDDEGQVPSCSGSIGSSPAGWKGNGRLFGISPFRHDGERSNRLRAFPVTETRGRAFFGANKSGTAVFRLLGEGPFYSEGVLCTEKSTQR